MKTKIILISILVVLPFLAHAGEKENLAEEIMKLTNMQTIMDQMKSQLQQMQNRMMRQFNIPEKDKEKALQLQKNIQEKIFNELSWDKMKTEYVKIFTDVYTEEELKGIAEFYKSAVGQSLIRKQPVIIRKSMMISQSKMRSLISELQRMTQEFEKLIKEK